MTIRKLNKSEWRRYFDFVSRGIEGKRAEIEVASLSLGDQVEADWLPLLGIVNDPKDDVVEIALDGLDHMIRKPREIYIDDSAGELTSVEIVGAEGVRQIVHLREPLMLPPPQTQTQTQTRT